MASTSPIPGSLLPSKGDICVYSISKGIGTQPRAGFLLDAPGSVCWWHCPHSEPLRCSLSSCLVNSRWGKVCQVEYIRTVLGGSCFASIRVLSEASKFVRKKWNWLVIISSGEILLLHVLMLLEESYWKNSHKQPRGEDLEVTFPSMLAST